MSSRASYIEAGRAMRIALTRASEFELSLADRKVLDAVLAATVSYSKLSDRLPLVEIAEAAGCSDRQARRSLKRLRELGIVLYVSGRGQGNFTEVGLPTESGQESGQMAVPFGADESGQNGPLKADRSAAPKRTASRVRERAPRRTEKWTEKRAMQQQQHARTRAKLAPAAAKPPPPRAEDRCLGCDRDGEVDVHTNLCELCGRAAEVLAAFNELAHTDFGRAYSGMVRDRVAEHPDVPLDRHRQAIARTLGLSGSRKWWKGEPSPNLVYANSRCLERALNLRSVRERRRYSHFPEDEEQEEDWNYSTV